MTEARVPYKHAVHPGNDGEKVEALKRETAVVWEAIKHTTVDKVTKMIRKHEKSLTFAYVDITLVIEVSGVLIPLKLCGLMAKQLKQDLRIDFIREKGGDEKWYDKIFPKSEAFRNALTHVVFSDPEIQECMKEAVALCESESEAHADAQEGTEQVPSEASATAGLSEDNPFADAVSS
jgi:hypothetical protein